jgi:Flp pilus assembly protein TadD
VVTKAEPTTARDMSAGSKTGRRDLFIVALAAVVVRALYFWERAGTESFWLPIVDSEVFDSIARNFAAGSVDSTQDWYFHGVGYPTILGSLYWLFGSSMAAAKAVQLAFGSLTAVLTCVLGRSIFDRRVGLVAGLIVALYAPLFFLEGELLDVGWSALAAVGLVLLTLKAGETKNWKWGLGWGLVAGASVLLRATFLPFVVLVLIAMTFKGRRADSARHYGWLWAAAGPLVVILAGAGFGALRNSGHFSFLPSAAGLNLFLGNNPDSCHTLAMRPGLDWNLLVRMPTRAGVDGIWNKSHWFMQQAFGYALHSPGSFVAGLFRKTAALFVSREVPRNLDIYLFRQDSVVLSAGVWKAGSFGFPFGVLLPLAALGAVLERRRIPGVIWLMLASYSAALVVVFVVGRYRIALVPLLAVLAAAGAFALANAVRARDRASIIRSTAVGGLAMIVTLAPWRFCPERVDMRPELVYMLASAHKRQGDADAAERGFREALALDPTYFEARHDLGRLLMATHRLPDAIAELTAASAQHPDHVPLLLDLAVALGQNRQIDAAVNILERARTLDPKNPAVYSNLGMAAVSRGDFGRAVEEFERAVELDPGSAVYRENLERAMHDARR